MHRSKGPRGRLRNRPAFSLLELLVSVAIMSMTTYLAISVYNPGDSARIQTSQTQLEQLGQAVVLYNLNHPGSPFDGTTGGDPLSPTPWWTALGSDFHDKSLADPWGAPYEHDPGRGMVYSYGPDKVDEVGEGDDLFYYYRPPSAFVRNKTPAPGTTTKAADPLISSEWAFRGSAGVATATVSLDGMFVPDTDVTLTDLGSGNYLVAYNPPSDLAEGNHTVRMMAVDNADLKGRANWSFNVDTNPPEVYAVQPHPGTETNFRAFSTTAYYRDLSGVGLVDTNPDESPILSATGPGGAIPAGSPWSGPAAIRAAFNGIGTATAEVTPGSLTLTPPSGGWPFGTYTFDIQLRDTIGNQMAAAHPWSFTVKDDIAPFLTVQLPAYASTLTSSDDLDPLLPGVQVNVLGSTEPGATVYLDAYHPDSSGSHTYTSHTSSNNFGQFLFPGVPVLSFAGTPIPTNTFVLKARDANGNETTDGGNPPVRHVVFLYDDSSTVDIEYAVATPQTTRPNEPIEFSVGASGGTTPYDITWEFGDGYSLGSVLTTTYTSGDASTLASLQHTYIETGSYSVTVRARDSNGLEASRLLSVYIGTETGEPKIHLNPVPDTFATGSPGADHTDFQITLEGKFLGAWRLKVDGSNISAPGYRWWYTGNNSWVSSSQESADLDDPGSLWVKASSNNFAVPWFGLDNTDFSPIQESDETFPVTLGEIDDGGFSRAFPGNDASNPSDVHVATLEYQDAFGHPQSTTAPIVVYNNIPTPVVVRIVGIGGDTESPLLFDSNLDGVWDYTRYPRVDLAIPQPPTSNNTDLWISNYPVNMHIYTKAVSGNPFTTLSVDVPAGVNPRGEVFQNFTLADGPYFDGTDGSSGWTPHRPDGTYRLWDLTADMASLGYSDSSLPWPNPLPPVPECSPPSAACPDLTQGSYYQASTGLDMGADGLKTVNVIFRSVGPFISTQLGINDNNPNFDGVTTASIFLDRTPPNSLKPIELSDIQVVKGSGGQEWVVATFGVLAGDLGAGMTPRGKAVVKVEGQADSILPYTPELSVTLGKFSELSSGDGSIQATATILFEDNLGNRSADISGGATQSYVTTDLNLLEYTWTLIGSGDLQFYQATIEPDGSSSNVRAIDHARIDSHAGNDIPLGNSYLIYDWFNANLGGVPEGAVDGGLRAAETNIDPANFPNPADRLGVVQSVRPQVLGSPHLNIPNGNRGSGDPLTGVVEAQQTFPVDKDHCYLLQLEKPAGEGDVFYVVREFPKAGSCSTFESGDGKVSGTVVAKVNKVVNRVAGRLNFGVIRIPRDLGGSSSNAINDRFRDLHADGTGAPDPSDYWDQVRDLIQSTDPTPFKTYTYRGVVGDFDSGTVGDIDYKISIDSFQMRPFFVNDPLENYPGTENGTRLTDATTADAPGAATRYVKVVHWDNPLNTNPSQDLYDTTFFGMGPPSTGPHGTFTELLDAPEVVGGTTIAGKIGGARFKVRLADQSNAFSFITSGALQAGGFIMFGNPAGGNDFVNSGVSLTPVDQPRLSAFLNATSVPLDTPVLLPQLVPPATSENVVGAFYFQDGGPGNSEASPIEFNPASGPSGNPFPVHATGVQVDYGEHPAEIFIHWPYLIGREGTVRAVVVYKDLQGNFLGPVVKDAIVDGKPPKIDEIVIRARAPAALDFVKFSYEADSSKHQHWTSSDQIELMVVGDEATQVFREFLPGDNNNVPPNHIASANPTGCAAPAASVGAAPPPCDISNWYDLPGALGGGFTATEDLTLNLGAAPEGPVTATLRFRDEAYNYQPLFSGIQDDGPAAESTYTTYVYVDTVAPKVRTLRMSSPTPNNVTDYATIRGNDPRVIEAGGMPWTNDPYPKFDWDVQDPAPSSSFYQVGVNVTLQVGPGAVSLPNTAGWPFAESHKVPGNYTRVSSVDLVTPDGISGISEFGNCNGCSTFPKLGPGVEEDENYFKLFVQDGVRNGDSGGTQVPTDFTSLNNCVGCESFAYQQFGFDDVGPTINPATVGLTVQHIPGHTYEEMTATQAGASPLTLTFPTQAYLDVDRVTLSLARGAVGQSNDLVVTAVELFDGATLVGAVPALVGTYSYDDSSTWSRTAGALALGQGDRIRVTASRVGLDIPFHVRVEGSRLVPDLAAPEPYTPTVALGTSGDPYPSGANPFFNGVDVRMLWNEINVAVFPDNGVGVHQTDRADGSLDASEWDFRVNNFGLYTLTDQPQALLDFNLFQNQALTPQLAALDRLENRGPPILVFDSYLDTDVPDPVTTLDLPGGQIDFTSAVGARSGTRFTNASPTLQWDSVDDQDPGNAAEEVRYALVRSIDGTAPDLTDGAFLGIEPFASTPPHTYTFATNLATDGTEDDLYHFAVYPEDRVDNRNDTLAAADSGNHRRVLLDSTPPLVAAGLDTSAPTLVKRNRSAGSAVVCGPADCNDNWTNDTALALQFSVSDLARNHHDATRQGRAGSGVAEIQFSDDGCTSFPDNITFNESLTPSVALPGGTVISAGGVAHGFNFDEDIIAASTGILAGLNDYVPDTGTRWEIGARAVDRVGNPVSNCRTTHFFFDTTGPVFPSAGGDHIRYEVSFGNVQPVVGTDLLVNVLGEQITVPGTPNYIRIEWSGAYAVNGYASDPGYPGTGVGMDPSEGAPPVDQYRWTFGVIGSGTVAGQNFVEIDISGMHPLAGGDFYLYPRDQLGNEGAGVKLFEILSDDDPPVGYLDWVCQDADCTSGPGLALTHTGPTATLAHSINLAQMNNNIVSSPFAPCAAAVNADDGDYFWIRGRATDIVGPVGGMDTTAPNELVARIFNVAAPGDYDESVDIFAENGTNSCFDITVGVPLNADELTWWARFPTPQFAGAPANRWDHYGNTPADINYGFQIYVEDKATNDNTPEPTRYKRIDLRGPLALTATGYENTGTWGNLGHTTSGASWTVSGSTPSIGGGEHDMETVNWPKVRVTESDGVTPVSGMTWQVATTYNPAGTAWSHNFPTADTAGAEADDYQIHIEGEDIYGNASTGSVALPGVKLDTVLPTSTMVQRTTPGCAIPTTFDMEGVCSDGFCDTLEIQWDGGLNVAYSTMAVPAEVDVNNTPDLGAAVPEFQLANGTMTVPGTNYKYQVIATDLAGNTETALGLPANDTNYTVAAVPSGTIDNWEESGGWVNKAANADDWTIDGTWTSCVQPLPSEVEIQILPHLAWTTIDTFGGTVSGVGNTWSVDIPAATWAGQEDNSVTIEVRITNPLGTGTLPSQSTQVDTVDPTITIDNWEETGGWINIASVAGGWTIDGSYTEGFLDGAYPRIQITEPSAGATPLNVGNFPLQTVDSAGIGSWDHTWAIGLLTGGDVVESKGIRIDVVIQDQAGNTGSANETGLQLDTLRPTSSLVQHTVTGCAALPNLSFELQCSDGYCDQGTIRYDDSGSYVDMAVGTEVTPSNPVADDPIPGAGNAEWTVQAAAVGTAGKTYRFVSVVTDEAGNVETAVPAHPANDYSITAASVPSGAVTGYEEAGGWVDKASNDDDWTISGTWNSCVQPVPADVEIRIEPGHLGWTPISSYGGVVTAGNTWTVDVPQAVMNLVEDTGVTIEARITNPLGTGTLTSGSTQVDTIPPTVSIDNWEETGGWINIASNSGGWTIDGSYTETHLDGAYPRIVVTETVAGPTPLNAGNFTIRTVDNAGVGSWDHTWASANLSGGNVAESQDIRIDVTIQDQAGNTGSDFVNGLDLDTKSPTSTLVQHTPTGCAVMPALDFELVCTDGFCKEGTIRYDDSGSYADMTVGTEVNPSNPVADDPVGGSANAEWTVLAAAVATPGKTYRWVSVAEDLAGNVEAAGDVPSHPSSDYTVTAASPPTGSIDNAEDGDGWLNDTESGDGWLIEGTWGSCVQPTGADIEIRIAGIVGSWTTIDSYTHSVTAGNYWSVTIPSGSLTGIENNSVVIEAQITNPQGTTVLTSRNTAIDTVAPVLTITDWEEDGSGWVNAASAAGNWRITGTLVEGYPDNATFEVQAPDAGFGWTTVDTPGTWTHDFALGALEDSSVDIAVQIQDQAGNSGGDTELGVQIDTIAPSLNANASPASGPTGGSGTIFNILDGDVDFTGGTVTENGSGMDSGNCQIELDGVHGPVAFGSAPAGTGASLGWTHTFTSGNLSATDGGPGVDLLLTLVDQAGNNSGALTDGTYTFDYNAPPAPPVTDVTNNNGSGQGTPGDDCTSVSLVNANCDPANEGAANDVITWTMSCTGDCSYLKHAVSATGGASAPGCDGSDDGTSNNVTAVAGNTPDLQVIACDAADNPSTTSTVGYDTIQP